MSEIYEATTKEFFIAEEILGMGEVNKRAVGYVSGGGESLFGAFAKLRKATVVFVTSVPVSFHPSVCPHGTTRLPLDGYL